MSRFYTGTRMDSLINDYLKKMGMEGRVKEQMAFVIWDEVVGDKIAFSAQPEFIRDGKLFVATKSPVWANELNFFKKDIIEKLNLKIGSKVIRDIIFKSGRFEGKHQKDKKPVRISNGFEGITLTDDEIEKVKKTAEMGGGTASDSLRELMETAIKLEKWKESQGWTPCRKCGALQNTRKKICPVCELDGKQ